MPQYRVKFFKTLINCDGHRFNCLQQQYDIPDAGTAAEAEITAARQFADRHRLKDWKQAADTMEVEKAEG